MLAKDVLCVLGITRPTLTKYVKTGTIRVNVLPNRHTAFPVCSGVIHRITSFRIIRN